jgi:hypothetical protein
VESLLRANREDDAARGHQASNGAFRRGAFLENVCGCLIGATTRAVTTAIALAIIVRRNMETSRSQNRSGSWSKAGSRWVQQGRIPKP